MSESADIRQEDLLVERIGDGPVIATAIHAGHEVRRELLPFLALDEATRAREEDPYTDFLVKVVPSWIVFRRSRFEVDVNRPREEAVYTRPEMAWGLQLWKRPLPETEIERSLEEYDRFYAELERVLRLLEQRHGCFVVFDIHSYNHRRRGPHAPPDDPRMNPDVNVGTGSMDRRRCGPVVERFMRDLRAYDFMGRHLDVRENVKFRGRQLAQWIHRRFPDSACVLAIEFKKIFMDEWTGVADVERLEELRRALESTLPGLMAVLPTLPGCGAERETDAHGTGDH
ncbi:MAG TPA: N-formylglutamate amidohydrolase [Thiotrichales bacterium]|nr:N-formylglutamate amidohydrolase [Thiotrichales bacterium]